MYPTLYHMFYDLFAVDWAFLKPLNSFGMMVALAFVAAAYVYRKEIIRKEEAGLLETSFRKEWVGKGVEWAEVIINGGIGFLLGFKIVYVILYPAVLDDFQHYVMSSNGSWIGAFVVAALLGGYTYYRHNKERLPEPYLEEKEIKPHHHIGPITFVALISGLVGAKLFAYLEDPQPLGEFFADPFSGMTIYGGLICGFVSCYIYVRKHRLHPAHMMDAVAPALILAYGIGRMGCHLSGDGDWGIEHPEPNPGWIPDWLWSYDYPNNILDQGTLIADCPYPEYCHRLTVPVYPTPLYEIIMCLGIFSILMWLRRKINIVGMIFFIYLMFNGLERFLIESIRVNDTYDIFGYAITQAQIISTCLFFLGVVGIIFLWKKPDFLDKLLMPKELEKTDS